VCSLGTLARVFANNALDHNLETLEAYAAEVLPIYCWLVGR